MTLTQITEKGIKDGEIVNADISSNTADRIAGSKINPLFTSNIEIQNNAAGITFTDTDDSKQFYIQTQGDELNIVDATNSTTKLGISNTGHITLRGNVTVNDGYLEVANANLYINENITHAGDGDTRIRFPAADAIALETGGNSSLYINSSGQVGIGTASPNRLIHGTGATPILKLDATNNEAYIQLVTASPSNESYIGLVSGDIYFSTSGTGSSGNGERLRIKANGRIGINSSSPSGTLSIADLNGDNVTVVLHTSATTNFIQFSDATDANAYIGKEGSQTSFYTRSTSGSAEKQCYINSNGLNIVAGKGVNFSPYDTTVSSPGSDSNSLQDYEEGTYVPTDSSGANLSLTQNTTARYTKIGRLVNVQFDISWPTNSSQTAAAITLPFTNSIVYGSGTVGWTDIGKPLQIHISTSAAIMDNDSPEKHAFNAELSGKRAIGSFNYMTT